MTDNNNPCEMTFRQALGAFTTGITVVTTRSSEGEDVGLTANSFNSVSLDPPMILWSLGKSAKSLPVFRHADHFAVHILSEDQQALSDQFAKSATDKFQGVSLERGVEGIPLLRDCVARFICRTAYQYEGGDHIIFVGEVIEFLSWEKSPLLFHRGKYGRISAGSKSARYEGKGDSSLMDDTLGFLLRSSFQNVMEPLKVELGERSISMSQWAAICMIARDNPLPLDKVFSLLEYGGTSLSREEVDTLVAQNIVRVENGVVDMTEEGFRLYLEIFSYYKAGEAQALSVLGPEAEKVLRTYLSLLSSNTPH